MIEKSQKKNPQQYHQFQDQQQVHLENQKSPTEKLVQVPQNTLDQSICSTVLEQIKGVFIKIWCVLIPIKDQKRKKVLRNWDLWGPFIMCLILGIVITSREKLIVLLCILIFGGIIVSINSQVLGAKVSILQSISILGYCFFPIFIFTIILKIMYYAQAKSELARMIFTIVSVLWSILAARAFMDYSSLEGKTFVSLYPICLFYIFIGGTTSYF